MKVKLIDHMGSDLTVVNAARVSFNNKHEEFEWGKDDKLIKFLAEHGHTSPFGHCFASFHVKCPIFVRSQLVKHKFLRVNEVSRRYVKEDPEFYFPDTWRSAVDDKKQGSGPPLKETRHAVLNKYEGICKGAARTYRRMLELGCCEEQARMVVPQGMYTEFYWSGSLDAFAAMARLRLGKDAQIETRSVAKQIDEIMIELFPISWDALLK